MYYESNYLAHYGVLGMKWGQRRAKRKSQLKAERDKRDNEILSARKRQGQLWVDLENKKKAYNDAFDRVYRKNAKKNRIVDDDDFFADEKTHKMTAKNKEVQKLLNDLRITDKKLHEVTIVAQQKTYREIAEKRTKTTLMRVGAVPVAALMFYGSYKMDKK